MERAGLEANAESREIEQQFTLLPGDEKRIQLEEERDAARSLELDAQVAGREVLFTEQAERHLQGMSCFQTSSPKYMGKGKGKGKGKGTEEENWGGESGAEVSGPSSASPHDAAPIVVPSLEAIPLGERVPDRVLKDLKARADACKARLFALKEGIRTPDMPQLGSSATPDMPDLTPQVGVPPADLGMSRGRA
ncbi:MAG: hypothetical protein AB2556_19655, partial [Candidatus Thiodiazotropha sp.]